MSARKEAELEWAKQKYDVMAKGYQHYSRIRDSFREAKEEEDYNVILDELGEMEKLPYSRKAFLNTAEHVWGYFKKSAALEEKNRFFDLLTQCRSLPNEFLLSQPESAKLLSYIKQTLLVSYPNPYLEQSALLKKVPGTAL
ncbi:YbgA family protein [Fictibacillus sp. KIGAM418]|uniref:YbgA family protein n=1 Tax=Fictibacillus marinisediminis TaxID=2878389 RepID=A0A9X2BIY8_9BACL|nr:DUF1722 domain-containing protein [Fictibacillus marinisediminis]MCK6259198.1 YbgA family protein [Fictibacillus marinisediminis]